MGCHSNAMRQSIGYFLDLKMCRYKFAVVNGPRMNCIPFGSNATLNDRFHSRLSGENSAFEEPLSKRIGLATNVHVGWQGLSMLTFK